MYTALYRSKRPEVFSSVLGQEHIVKILRNQIAQGTVNHAYLFCGTRGTGKTTVARLLAKAVNCLDEEGEKPCGKCANCMAIKEGNFLDVIEIDAASNNSVDDIRELRENVSYQPAIGKKKVYIIDEAHMLTTSASNALLKTLEEPPENVMFILATTDPQNLPQTILSRCLRLDFKRVPERIIEEHMLNIAKEQGVELTEDAVKLLAATADGSVRDGLSILDQCLAGGDKVIERDDVLELLGIASDDFFIALTEKVLEGDVSNSLLLLNDILMDGKDVKQIMTAWLSHYRYLLLAKYLDRPEDVLNMSTENVMRIKEQSKKISIDEINNGILVLAKTVNDGRFSMQPRVLLELAIVTLSSGRGADGNGDKNNIITKNLAGKRIPTNSGAPSPTNSASNARAASGTNSRVAATTNPQEMSGRAKAERSEVRKVEAERVNSGTGTRNQQVKAEPSQSRPAVPAAKPNNIQIGEDPYGEPIYDIDTSEIHSLFNDQDSIAVSPSKPAANNEQKAAESRGSASSSMPSENISRAENFSRTENISTADASNRTGDAGNTVNQPKAGNSSDSASSLGNVDDFDEYQTDEASIFADLPMDRENMDELWDTVLERAKDQMSSLAMLGKTVLVDLNDYEYKVMANNNFIKRLLATNAQLLDGIMEGLTGKKRRLIAMFDENGSTITEKNGGFSDGGQSSSGVDAVEEITNKLHIPVKVEN